MNYPLLYQWEQLLSAHLPSFNSWQQANVALFSYGVMQAASCQQDEVARQVACGERLDSTSRRWRRWLANEAVASDQFFRDWSRWVVDSLGGKQVTLLVDETKIQDRIGVLMVGVAWEGRCLPLAWRTYRANSAADYPAEGQVGVIRQLLEHVKQAIDATRSVLVLADRGIGCSPALCRAVAGLGWQYLFRVTCQTKVVTETGDYTIAQQVQSGEMWMQSGTVFKQRGKLSAHARALWGEGYVRP
jgi:hypothetical protein